MNKKLTRVVLKRPDIDGLLLIRTQLSNSTTTAHSEAGNRKTLTTSPTQDAMIGHLDMFGASRYLESMHLTLRPTIL